MKERKAWAFLFTFRKPAAAYPQLVTLFEEFEAKLLEFHWLHADVLMANPDNFLTGASGHAYIRLDVTPRGFRALQQFTGALLAEARDVRRQNHLQHFGLCRLLGEHQRRPSATIAVPATIA